MSEHNSISDVEIDRLVDGELSTEERNDVLLKLESDSDGWRRCGIAFLEAQAWTEAMGGSDGRSDRESREQKTATRSPRRAARTRMSWQGWMSVAAAVMIAFAMGIASERLPRRIDDPAGLASDVKPALDPLGPVADSAIQGADGLTLVVHNDQGEPQQVDVPIVDWEAGKEWLSQGSVSPHENQIRDQLRMTGSNIGRREQYFAPIETDDGRRFVVPIQRWDVVPMSNRDYQ